MRIGVIRDDLGRGILLADLSSKTHRTFSHSPDGQQQTIGKPSDAEIASLLLQIPEAIKGSNTDATVDTSSNDTLRIKHNVGSFRDITVTAGAATPKTTIAADLNADFTASNIPLVAKVETTNELIIQSTIGGTSIEIDSVANGSTLSTAVGFTVGGESAVPPTVSDFKSTFYPTSTTIDVSSTTIEGFGTISSILFADQLAPILLIQETVAPFFVETGEVLLSYQAGVISKLRSASFRPGLQTNAPSLGTTFTPNLPAGAAIVVLQNDGVTPF